jgi:HSP20 family protein
MKHDAIVPSTSVGIKEMSLDELSKKVSEWSNRIAKRAYDLFAASGFTNGHDLDDWFKAEQELLKPIHPHVKDWGDEFVVIAEVPGFDAKDLNIQVNGAHVVIQGRHELSEERKEKSGNVSERNVHEIYHAFELPAGVVAKGAQADLKNGGLVLKLPKASKLRQIKVTAA